MTLQSFIKQTEKEFEKLSFTQIFVKLSQKLQEAYKLGREEVFNLDSKKMAMCFHHNYEMNAPKYDYKTRKDILINTDLPNFPVWGNLQCNQRKLMIETCENVITQLKANNLFKEKI